MPQALTAWEIRQNKVLVGAVISVWAGILGDLLGNRGDRASYFTPETE